MQSSVIQLLQNSNFRTQKGDIRGNRLVLLIKKLLKFIVARMLTTRIELPTVY